MGSGQQFLKLYIPILQAKFYYIPPLEGRFQTFFGIDIWNSIPHCSTMGNWSIPHVWGINYNHALSIPHMWGIEIVSTVEKWNHAISIPHMWRIEIKILCAIWECQSFTKEKKGLGKIPHLSLVAKPLVTHGEFYFSPLVASPLRGEKSNPFFSSVKDWVNSYGSFSQTMGMSLNIVLYDLLCQLFSLMSVDD